MLCEGWRRVGDLTHPPTSLMTWAAANSQPIERGAINGLASCPLARFQTVRVGRGAESKNGPSVGWFCLLPCITIFELLSEFLFLFHEEPRIK